MIAIGVAGNFRLARVPVFTYLFPRLTLSGHSHPVSKVSVRRHDVSTKDLMEGVRKGTADSEPGGSVWAGSANPGSKDASGESCIRHSGNFSKKVVLSKAYSIKDVRKVDLVAYVFVADAVIFNVVHADTEEFSDVGMKKTGQAFFECL